MQAVDTLLSRYTEESRCFHALMLSPFATRRTCIYAVAVHLIIKQLLRFTFSFSVLFRIKLDNPFREERL